MCTRLAAWMIAFVLACSALPALLAQTTAESSTNAADVNRRIQDLEKELKELRAEMAAMKQSSTTTATRRQPPLATTPTRRLPPL